jgi:hypothetical protein
MATIPLNRSLVGERVGSYLVERELGGGGMGAVFVARHAVLGQKTAVIKVLHAELAMRRDLVARFEGEARAATAIAHPSIVHVEDFGTLSTGEPYIVMEHLAGGDLAQYVAEHAPIALEEVLAIMLQVCPGLDAAHDRGIIHRDLKPANIFRLPDGRVKILDFGIAKLADDLATPFRTSANAVAGTPAFMSPEQCRSTANVDRRSDVFALGVILYVLTTERLPWSSETPADHVHRIDHERPLHPLELRPDLPLAWNSAILAALSKEPSQRPATAGALLDRLLRGFPGGDRIRRRVAELVAGMPSGDELAAGSVPPPVLGPTDLTVRAAAGGAPGSAGGISLGLGRPAPGAYPVVISGVGPPAGAATMPSMPSGVDAGPASLAGARQQETGGDAVPTAIEDHRPERNRESPREAGSLRRSRKALGRAAMAGALAAASVLLLVVITRGDERPSQAAAAGAPDAVAVKVAALPDDTAVAARTSYDAAVPDAAPPEASSAVAAIDGRSTTLPIEAAARPATAKVATTPRVLAELGVYCLDSSCDVFVDGVRKGSTPVTTRVPVGAHTVRLQHPENKDQRVQRRITVKAGQKNEISHSWNP